ncbi:MAG: ribonuclease J [Lachnospiraceae bacterium]|nr:ribonuclease J [Lachnospiraceae bacterium]
MSSKGSRRKKEFKIIPLGGLEQVGMNITAFCYGEDIIVVDCGLAFPSDDMLGIDLVIPDVTFLREHRDQVRGFFITHGHEDHIGALPYVLREVPAPVYGTQLTIAIIANKLEEATQEVEVPLEVVEYGDVVTCGALSVEYIRTNHSIAGSSALAITSPAGTVIHTGDFKIDFTPVYGDTIDLQRLGVLGTKGVLALLCDSTNALKPGMTMSERTVGKTFDNIFADNATHRIIVATFASNVDRIQQIIDCAVKYGRKVAIDGRSMVNIVNTAVELGYIRMPENLLIPLEEISRYPSEQTVLIMTGSQGEPMAALSRVAACAHKKIAVLPGDVVIISSTPIPGNEKSVFKLINDLSVLGAHVIFQDTHVSGHACQDEIRFLYSLIRPKYAIPIHGEFRHRIAQRNLVLDLGWDKENVIVLKSGDVLSLSSKSAEITDTVPARGILVDGLGIGDVGNIVLRDRQYLSENGIFIVSVCLDTEEMRFLSGPEIVTKGFVYIKDAEDMINRATDIVNECMENFEDSRSRDVNRLKADIRNALSEFIWRELRRRPMILPIVTECF